jgi:ABC-2 type transport system permease protein
MNKNYSQLKAMMAIVKASFIAQLKSPSALVFGFIFPLFFILIFGSGNRGIPQSVLRFTSTSDTNNVFFKLIDTSGFYDNVKMITNLENVKDSMIKGRISAIVDIQKSTKDSSRYIVKIQPSKATESNVGFIKMMFDATFFNIQKFSRPGFAEKYDVEIAPAIGDRVYKAIDSVLPGQLGFSLLSAGLFGVAFLFFNLRDTLVLKRLNATPIKKPFIILGEALARVLFQMIIVSIIILIGKFLFGFTLVHGLQTFIDLLILSFIGLIVFMGFGFVISGAAKSINTVPVLTNLIGFPQFMLSGTFFPYKGLPSFLHPLCKILPLTHLNDALRKVAFEGLSVFSCLSEIGVLCIWIVVIYGIAFKIFKWE